MGIDVLLSFRPGQEISAGRISPQGEISHNDVDWRGWKRRAGNVISLDVVVPRATAPKALVVIHDFAVSVFRNRALSNHCYSVISF